MVNVENSWFCNLELCIMLKLRLHILYYEYWIPYLPKQYSIHQMNSIICTKQLFHVLEPNDLIIRILHICTVYILMYYVIFCWFIIWLWYINIDWYNYRSYDSLVLWIHRENMFYYLFNSIQWCVDELIFWDQNGILYKYKCIIACVFNLYFNFLIKIVNKM